jgi:hypothetical protein
MNLYVLVNQPTQTFSALEAHGYFPKELQDGIKKLSISFHEAADHYRNTGEDMRPAIQTAVDKAIRDYFNVLHLKHQRQPK